MPTLIYRERLPFHPRLGRNVNHDSRSRAYRVQVPRQLEIRTVRHQRMIPVFDQGQLGSCTGNSGIGCLGTTTFHETLPTPYYPWDQTGAVALYSAATRIDPFSGTYPPDDTGSDGLSIAKVLKAADQISGYLWAFTPEEARGALMQSPVITGIPWLTNMFNPTGDGQVVPDGLPAGGHEIVADGYVMLGDKPSNDDQVWFTNSWGGSWGVGGHFWMRFGDWADLLADNGDVTQFVPLTAPAPPPPPDDSDDTAGDRLWAATEPWTRKRHRGCNDRAAKAVRQWAKDTGRA
jgi:hypothetical protein